MAQQMRVDAFPDALVLGAALEPRAHAAGCQRLAEAAAWSLSLVPLLMLALLLLFRWFDPKPEPAR